MSTFISFFMFKSFITFYLVQYHKNAFPNKLVLSVSLRLSVLYGPHFPVLGRKTSKSPYSVRIQENTDQKKLSIWTLFMQCLFHLKNCVAFPGFGKKSQPDLSFGLVRKYY